jgi:tetratricopeptide (TPR) repeat protein
MAAFEADTLGRQALERGSTNLAVRHYRTAAELHPTAERYFRLGHALEENGESMPAVEAFDKSKDVAGNDANLIRAANLKLANLWAEHLGDYAGALHHVNEVLDANAAEDDAVAIDQKAFFLAACGQYDKAIDLWERALALKDAGKGSAVDEDVKLYKAIAQHILGRGGGQFDLEAMRQLYSFKVSSWEYVLNHPPTTRPEYWHIFSGTATLLHDALCAARPDGLICEFGVFHGKSIRLLASLVGPHVTVDGFDTFEGIPEQWGDEPAGSYTAASEIPERCPLNVRFHVGLFADTLPGYVEAVGPPEKVPVRLINVDCDLYQGTVEIMEYLAPRIGPGTVIVFDEYLMTPTWIDDEYKAFQEAVQKFGWTYDYLAYSLFSKQAVVRILESASFVGPPAIF